MARALGISRERVRQLLVAEGITAAEYLGRPVGRPRGPQPKSVVTTGGVPVPINATVAGTIGEMLVAADLLTRGWLVYLPIVRNAGCDLVVVSRGDNRVERIEVRTARRVDGVLRYASPDKSQSDRRAIVCSGECVTYEPPYDGDPRRQRRRRER
jgi:hypothetical protein